MKNQLIMSILVEKAFPKMQILIITFISILLLTGCKEEKIPRLTYFYFPKLLMPDSSLSCQVKDTIVDDTLFVDLKITNTSAKTVFIPLNNWYIFGFPISLGEYNIFNHSYPDYNEKYNCNILLFSDGSGWKRPNLEFYTPMVKSLPIIKKLMPGDSFYFEIKILNQDFSEHNINKVKINGNIIYSIIDNYKSLIELLKFNERKILRDYDTLINTYNLNPYQNTRNLFCGNPYTRFSDSSGLSAREIFTETKDNTYYNKLIQFRRILVGLQNKGYYIDSSLIQRFNNELELYDSDPDKNFQLISFVELLDEIIFRTYCYSVKFKNY